MTPITLSRKRPKPEGRPPILSGGKRVNVYLDTVTLSRARKLGKGNLSVGLRMAVQRAKEPRKAGYPPTTQDISVRPARS